MHALDYAIAIIAAAGTTAFAGLGENTYRLQAFTETEVEAIAEPRDESDAPPNGFADASCVAVDKDGSQFDSAEDARPRPLPPCHR